MGGETTTNTLAVGRHVAHLTASSTHLAFACGTCHVVPASGNISHASGYVASANLQTTGHHGDLTNGPSGGSVTTSPPGGTCGTNYSCAGTCHNHNHNNDCWD